MNDSLLALLLYALLVGLCYAIGRGAAKSLPSLLARFVVAVPVGMGILSLVLLALGVCGWFVKPVFYALFALGMPGVAWLLRDVWAHTREVPPPKTVPADGSRLLDLGFAALFAGVALCTLIAALAPPGGGEWDALSYHLTVPKTYLMAHRVFYVPYDHHSNFPFLLQMLYTLMLGAGSVAGAKLCHWGCGVMLALSVYTFAARHNTAGNGHRTGQIAALIVASSPIVLWEAGIAYVDLATALYTWLSVSLLLPFSAVPPSGEGSPRGGIEGATVLLSALLMGFAIGTKWTVLGFWGITLAGMATVHAVSERKITLDLLKRLTLWAFVSLIVASPWLLRSYLYTGNPVYPYFYSVFGGRYWNAENAAQYSADQGTLGLGKSPVFALLAPWLMNALPTARKFNEYPFGFAPCLVPLLLAAPFSPRKFGKTSVILAVYALLGYVFWFFLVQGTRYLLPILPVVALLAAEVVMHLWSDAKGYAKYAASVAVAASSVFALWLSAQVFAVPAVRVVTGAQTKPDYIAQTQWMDTQYPAAAWINTNAPPNAKVALFDVVFGYYINRPILWANPNHSGTLLPWASYATKEAWLADFKQRGYTYLLTDEAFAPGFDSPLQSQAWRTWLPEAVSAGLVEVVFEKANADGQVCRVYRVL